MKEKIRCLSLSSLPKKKAELRLEVRKIQLNFKIWREKSYGSYKFGRKPNKPKQG